MNNKRGVIFGYIQGREDRRRHRRSRGRDSEKAGQAETEEDTAGEAGAGHPRQTTDRAGDGVRIDTQGKEGREKTAEALQTEGGEGVRSGENHRITPLSDYQGRRRAGNTRRTHHKPQI